MKTRFTLFRRAGVFYCQDTETGQQRSLPTRDEAEAKTLLHAKNESYRQSNLNLQIARACVPTEPRPILTSRPAPGGCRWTR